MLLETEWSRIDMRPDFVKLTLRQCKATGEDL